MVLTQRKIDYMARMKAWFVDYKRMMIVHCDHVGSQQMHDIRIKFRGKAVILMGKNTMIRKGLRELVEEGHTNLESIIPHCVGNVGFVMTNGDLSELRDVINEMRLPASAKAGVIAPSDVHIPSGDTGMEPTQTSFLQALNIPSKINKGQIQIISDVHLIKKGNRVGSSEAALCSKLSMKPFEYGLEIRMVYEDGCCYGKEVMDITDEDLMASFAAGIGQIAALSLGAGYPTAASFPHSIINGFKNIVAIALEVEGWSFSQADKVKEMLANPSAFAAAAPAAGAAAAAGGAAPAAAAVVEEEEEEEDMGFDLFD